MIYFISTFRVLYSVNFKLEKFEGIFCGKVLRWGACIKEPRACVMEHGGLGIGNLRLCNEAQFKVFVSKYDFHASILGDLYLAFGILCSLPRLGSIRPLTNRETFDIVSLILLGDVSIISGRDFHFWAPKNENPSLQNFFFFGSQCAQGRFLVNRFSFFWEVKTLKKVKFFVWQVLLGKYNMMDCVQRDLSFLVGPHCFILYRCTIDDFDHMLQRCQFGSLLWDRDLKQFWVSLTRSRDCASFFHEVLLFPPLRCAMFVEGYLFCSPLWHLYQANVPTLGGVSLEPQRGKF